MQKELTHAIDSFLDTSISHSIKRLLPADLKTLYSGPKESYDQVRLKYFETAQDNFVVDQIKGGFRIRPYLTYDW